MPKLWRFAATAAAVALLLAGIYASGVRIPSLGQAGSVPSVADDDSPPRVLAVNTLVARRTPSYLQLHAVTGIVRARRSGDLSFSRADRLIRILVDQGDRVTAGDAVAELNTRRLTEQKDKLKAGRDRAQQDLTKLIADSRLRSMESIRVEVRELKTQLNQINQEIQGSAAAGQDTSSMRDRLNGAQRRIDGLDATSRDPSVNAQQTAIAEMDEQIVQLETEIQASTLRAPYDGIIALRYVSDGILVSPEVPIMRIVERDSLQVWVGLPADVAQNIDKGQSQTITIGSKEMEAEVFAKLPELDRTTRTRTVVYSLDATASAQTLPGAVAQIELSRRVETSGFWLPITCLTRESDGLWSVYAVERKNDHTQVVSRRYVEVMHLEGQRARVRGTLDDGDAIIADGTHRVVPGQEVEALEVTSVDAEGSGSGRENG